MDDLLGNKKIISDDPDSGAATPHSRARDAIGGSCSLLPVVCSLGRYRYVAVDCACVSVRETR